MLTSVVTNFSYLAQPSIPEVTLTNCNIRHSNIRTRSAFLVNMLSVYGTIYRVILLILLI